MENWFKKLQRGIKKQQPRDVPKNLWTKCKSCDEIIYTKQLQNNYNVCPNCGYHFRVDIKKYIDYLLDDDSFTEYDADFLATDPLKFKDSKKYPARIQEAVAKSNQKEALVWGTGTLNGRQISFACLNFKFIGGSMGSVVGEKVTIAVEYALDKNIPLIIVSSSGGARMQEGILSLMQMAKTSAALSRLYDKKIPFISVLTHPTMAGVMASFASLGDVIIAEPGALLGFAGPRVIKQTIGKELPEGFQSSEFFQEHGFVDFISDRRALRNNLALVLDYLA